MEIIKAPWFAVSPSPWSLAFYFIMAVIGSRLLIMKGANYRKYPRLQSFLDAFFLLGLIVFIQDTIWLLFNTWKWILPLYSDTANFFNYYLRFPQNILMFVLFYLMVYPRFKKRIVSFNRCTAIVLLLIAVFTGAVFFLAPGQQLTDWTFAISKGFSDSTILQAFLISHVGYKLMIAWAFITLFCWADRG